MTVKRFTHVQREHRDAIFSVLCVAHGDLCERKIYIFYPVRYCLSRNLR
jgi:hypothetical protein